MQNPHKGMMEEEDYSNLTPSEIEYKKLKRVMKIMVKFYDDGSDSKLAQYEEADASLKRVETDIKMAEEQLASIADFPEHPRKAKYTGLINEELETMRKQRDIIEKKCEEYKGLHQWSLGIAEAVRWLEQLVDEYCAVVLGMDVKWEPAPRLSKEKYESYKIGLAEITTNLQESQDFFQAAIDGRFRKFQQQEKEMIEAQLKVLEKYPPMNERKAHWDGELNMDLEHLTKNMDESPAVMRRRQAMLTSHNDFWKVLQWTRAKLNTLAEDMPDITKLSTQ